MPPTEEEPCQPWLIETAKLLYAGRAAASTCYGSWSPAPGSHAAWELSQAEEVGWGEAVALVHVVLLDWTDALSGHLGALAAVVDAAEVTHSVPYIVRAVVEHAHKVSWILEPTQSAGTDSAPLTLAERAGRAHLEELYSLRHRRDTVKKMSGKGSDAFAECDRLLREFRDVTIPTRFGLVHGETSGLDELDQGRWVVAGQRWRGPTALAERFGRRQTGTRALDGTYEALCAYSHPTLYGHREFVAHLPAEGGVIRRRTISIDFLRRVIGGGAAAFWRASLDVASYFGWDRSPLDTWALDLNAWCPGLIASDPRFDE